jgi:sulfite reductase alpha subunit-like flavoprotein
VSRYAPIRGLLQKREHLKSSHENLGPAYLIFGTRCAEEGLFRGEIEMLVQKKVLGKVYMCYSRQPGQKKEYTSDKIRNDRVREVLARVLKTPTTHIYICGSANMAEQSKESLAYISSKETMELIEAEGRLHQDVFGALTSSSPAKTDVQLQGELRFDELEAVEKMN